MACKSALAPLPPTHCRKRWLLQSLSGWDHMSKLARLHDEAVSFPPGRRSVFLSPVSISYKLACLFKGHMSALCLAFILLP